MVAAGFQLDPALRTLSTAALLKKYASLTPEERVRLGLVRQATPEEFAAANAPHYAPADFGGPVYTSSTPPIISEDTDPGIPITRMPTGVSLQQGNWHGPMPADVSNPPAAELAQPTLHTVAANMSTQPTPKPSGTTVPLFFPGETSPRDVPYEEMHDNISKFGAKPGVIMKFQDDPDKKPRAVPADQVLDAAKNGGTIIPLQEQPAKQSGFWENIYENTPLKGIVESAKQMYNDPDEIEALPYHFVAGLVNAQAEQFQEAKKTLPAKTETDPTKYGESVGHLAAGALPVAGPILAKGAQAVGTLLGQENYKGAAGAGIGTAVTLLGPKLLPKAAAAIADTELAGKVSAGVKAGAGAVKDAATLENLSTAGGAAAGGALGHAIGEPVGLGLSGAALGKVFGKALAKRLATAPEEPAAPATLPEGFSPAPKPLRGPPGSVDNPAPAPPSARAAPAPAPAASAAAAVEESPLDTVAREGDVQPVLQKAYRDTLVQKIANPDTPYAERIRATDELHNLDHPELKNIQPRGAEATRQRFQGMEKPAEAGAPRPISGESALRQTLQGEDKPSLLEIAKERGVEVTPEDKLPNAEANGKLVDKIIDNFSDDELDGMRSQVTAKQLGQQLNDALGGKPLQKGVSLRNQGKRAAPPAADTSLPAGFTADDSSALQGHKYDPETREFESITQSGQHYVHGDVTPEAAQAFEDADSKGRAWQDIRKNGTLVAKVVNGTRVPIRRGPVSVDAEGTTLDPLTQKLNNLTEIIQASRGGGKPGVTPAIPPSDDLLENLQKSLDLVKKQRGQ